MNFNHLPKKPKIALIPLFNLDLGIRYISSYLKSKGYATDIISFGQLRTLQEIHLNNYVSSRPLRSPPYSIKSVQLLLDLLASLKPDLVGINVSSTTFSTASILTQKIKERFHIPIVWGGIHPTICPEDCIQQADIVCVGEGEYPMHELLQRLENNAEITAIKNLWIKHADGSIEKNELRDLILDLDSLPYPDFIARGNKFLIDRGQLIRNPGIVHSYLKNVYPIMSSRGCHFDCSFCCNNVLKKIYQDKGPYLRRRSPENVIGELVGARREKEFYQIRFADDVFTYDQEWVERFCQLYSKKVALPFFCYAHPKYTNKRIIEMLAEAGLRLAEIGIQSGSESFCRERLKREQSNSQIIEFSQTLKKLGVIPRYNVIMDNPYETDADADTTAQLLLKLPQPYIAALYSLCYFPKTELTQQALKDKLIKEEEVEGRSNKALNNFFLVVDLAKDKKRLFWDIIVSMAVSDFFSERFINRCKRSRFLRQHPRLFLSLMRLYLRLSLFSPRPLFDLFLRKDPSRMNKLFRKIPRFFLHLAELVLKTGRFFKDRGNLFISCNLTINKLKKFVIDTNNQPFQDKTGVDLMVFPKESSNTNGEGFYLKIRPKSPKPPLLPLKVLIDISPFMFSHSKNILGLWEIELEPPVKEREIEIELALPHLFFKSNGRRQEARLKNIRNVAEKGLYVAHFFLYDRSQRMYILKNCIDINMDGRLNKCP